MNNISKAAVIAAVAIMVAVFAVPMLSGDADAATDAWDGTADTSWYNDTSTEFTLKTAKELAGLASIVNEGNQLSGKTIILDSDIDLSGRAWTPIGDAPRVDYSTEIAAFAGKFIGNGHTINGLSSEGYTPSNDSLEDNSTEKLMEYMFGFFGYVYNAEISGLKFTNAELVFEVSEKDGYKYVADSVGVAVAYSQGDSKVSDVTVESGNVKGYDAVGGIVARSYGVSITIQNCISKVPVTATLENGGKAGGIIGIISLNTSASTLTNCTSSGYVSADFAGGILGYSGDGSKVIENCTSTGQIAGTTYAGGITGVGSSIKFTGCEYSGTISGASSSGGILGGSQSTAGDVDISDCNVHDSTITGINSAGGFIGSFLGTALDVEGGAVGKTSLNATSTVKPVAGGIVASIGEEPTVTIDGVSTDDTISMTVGNEDVIINDNTYAGNLSGAVIGLIEASINLTISNMEDFGSYEMIAECRIGESITLIGCHADNILDWMIVDGKGDDSNPIITLKSTHLAGIQSVRDVITLNADSESSIGTLYAGAYNGYETIDSMVYENSGDNIVTGEVVTGGNQTVVMDYAMIADYRIDKDGHYREYNGKIKGTDATSSIRINIGNEYLSAGTYQWDAVTSKWIPAVATVVAADGTTTSYTTLQAAINAAGNKSTITLLEDVTEAVTIPSGKVITIELNGHTIQNSTDAQNDKVDASLRNHTITNNGVLTIQDSVGTGVVDNKSHGKAAIYNTGNFTLLSGKLTRSAEASISPSDNGGNSWYVVYNCGTLNIKGGVVTQNGHLSSLVINQSVNNSQPVMNMTGGELSQEGFIALRVHIGATANISGGTISSGNQSIQNYGNVSITGGTISGNLTTIVEAGDTEKYYPVTTISGGTVEGQIRSWVYHAADGTATTDKTITVNITGGNIDAEIQSVSGPGSGQFNTVAPASSGIKVTGGTFNKDIDSGYLVTDYTMAQVGGSWTPNYTGQTYEATVNGINYPTVEAALDNANGGTVTLVAENASIDASYTFHGSATLDLDGKTLALGDGVQLTVSGDLTINGGGTVSFKGTRPIMINGGSLTLENCTVANDKSVTFTSTPAYIQIVGSEIDEDKYSVLNVGRDVTLAYLGEQTTKAYGIFINYINHENDSLSKYVAYGVDIDFKGTFEGNFGTLFYVNGQVKPSSGNVPEIHIDMDDDKEVQGMFYAAGYADWTIDGGNFTFIEMLSIRAGSFEINGGIFHATGEFKDPPLTNNNGSENTGAAVTITSSDSYPGNISVTINGGTFISDNGYAFYEGISEDSSGTPSTTKSTATISIEGGNFSGGKDESGKIRDAVSINTAPVRNVISGGSFNTDVSKFAAEGYAVVPNGDGTYGTIESDTPTGIIIDSDGDSINVETAGVSITIPAAPGPTYSNVTVTVGFPKGEVTVTGTVSGAVTVAFMELADLQGNDFAFNLVLTGIATSGAGSVTITIPVNLDADQKIESVTAYSVVNGEKQEENATVSGNSVIITTDHNTPFYVNWVLGTVPSQGGGSDDPFVDDDDDSPLPPIIGPGGSGSSSSSGDDDTVTIVACAAAAVVAALMAVFLIVLYRKD